MNRSRQFFIAAFIGAMFLFLAHRPASAMVEFCPAMLNFERVTSGSSLVRQQSSHDTLGTSKLQTSSLYGFTLNAYAARTVTSTTLAFDTSAGWFTVDLPAVTIAPKDRHYNGPLNSFVIHDYVSPVMYVRFPKDVQIAHAWVYSASAANSAPVTCDPPPAASPKQIARMKADYARAAGPKFYSLDPKDEDHLSDPPSASSQTFEALSAKPLETGECAEPFRYAEVDGQAPAQFPTMARDMMSGPALSTVTVAIGGNGDLAGSEMFGTSGYEMLDNAAMTAARASTYNGARAYCQAVPSYYFFKVTFDPNP
jgi:hypothetical protein